MSAQARVDIYGQALYSSWYKLLFQKSKSRHNDYPRSHDSGVYGKKYIMAIVRIEICQNKNAVKIF